MADSRQDGVSAGRRNRAASGRVAAVFVVVAAALAVLPTADAQPRDPDKDYTTLAGDSDGPFGIWSDQTTTWVADRVGKLHAYVATSRERLAASDYTALDAANNDFPRGIWSNGTTMWVADNVTDRLYAYKVSDRTRDAGKDFATLAAAGNNSPNGIWSNGTTMWVADMMDDKLYAYKLSDKTRDPDEDFGTLNGAQNNYPTGIWSNGTTMWVADGTDNKLYAYGVSDKVRDRDKEVRLDDDHHDPRGIWSDGTTMWVVDEGDGDTFSIRAYDLFVPGISVAVVHGATLTLVYNRLLDESSQPAAADFTVTVAGSRRTVSGVAVNGAAVTLTLASPVAQGETVTVSYTPGDAPLRSTAGGDAGSLASQAVRNVMNTIAVTSSAGTDATYAAGDAIEVTVTFGETVTVDATSGTPWIGLDVGGVTKQAAYDRGSGMALVFGYTVEDGDADGDGVSIAAGAVDLNGGTIAVGGDDVPAPAHPALAAEAGHKVDGVKPAFRRAGVAGATLSLIYDEALDGASNPASSAFTVQGGDQAARSVTRVSVSGDRVDLTVDPAVAAGETGLTLSYAAPATTPLRDVVGNAADGFTGEAVTNATDQDYDTDDDGLIEISRLAQLDAVRHDLDGDGVAATAGETAYAAAFPTALARVVCGSDEGCTGYELIADLDFDTNGSGAAGAGDAYWRGGAGWAPLGTTAAPFAATFEGNAHRIAHLFLDPRRDLAGLFGDIGASSVIRHVGLIDVEVRGRRYWVGALAGRNAGAVTGSYATGRVSGQGPLGGLVGQNTGTITASHAAVRVAGAGTASRDLGGLVGRNGATGQTAGAITASYATGRVSGYERVGGLVGRADAPVTASYATGRVSGASNAGGLVGSGSGVVTASYWDTRTSGQTTGTRGEGRTTAALQAPTGYSGIYGSWNVDLDGDNAGDDPWHFGTNAQYPVLSVDFDGDRQATWQEFGRQLRAGPTLTATGGPGQVALSWTAVDASHWNPAPGVTYTLTRDDGATVETAAEEVGGLAFTDTGLASETEYTYQVAAVVGGGEATRGALVSATTSNPSSGANQAPQAVGSLSALALRIADGAATVDVSGAFQDPDNDVLTYGVVSSAPAVASARMSGSVVTLTPLTAGVSTVTVTATDAAGSNTPATQQFVVTVEAGGTVDYDADDDGLIEIATLAQLDAVRHDLDGDGAPTETGATAYGAALPDPISGMGCPAAGCAGYELVADLDFDTDGSGSADAGDAYWNAGAGWAPLGSTTAGFATTFEGNGHTVAHLFINGGDDAGLFGVTDTNSTIRHVGVVDAAVTGASRVGGLVGQNIGTIRGSYAAGSVSGGTSVGGLVGFNVFGGVVASYATAVVSGATSVGGLVGGNFGFVSASYATGAVTGAGQVGGLAGQHVGVVAVSYATGRVSGDTEVGGLAGAGGGRVTASYWDQETSGWTGAGAGTGQSTSGLQGPTGYAGLYAGWDVDVDGDGAAGAPWHFGTDGQYPALAVDFDRDGQATWQEFGRQLREGPAAKASSPASGTPVEVTWTAVDTGHWTPSPAVTYAVYRRAGDSEALVADAVEGLSHTDAAAEAGIEYRYQVASRLAGGEPSRSGAVGPNRSPETVGGLSAVTLRIADGAVTVDVSAAFRDLDGDALTYGVVSSAPAVASVSMSSSVVTLTPLMAGVSTVTVTATDTAGSNTSATQQFVVTVANRPPEPVGTLSDRTLQIADGASTVDVSGAFRDLDGDALTYGAASSTPAVATVSVSSSTLTLTPLSAGVSTVTVTATDAAGSNTSATQQFVVTVANRSPEAVGTLSARTLRISDGPVTVDVSGGFRDLDGDALTYGAVSSTPAVATVSVSSSTLTLTPLSAGVSTATVTATDAGGSNTPASQQFVVTVEAGDALDYDGDDDGLIEIRTLAQLDAVRHDLDGDGAATETGATAYEAAYPDPVSGMGCPTTGCAGYELVADLDFDTDGSGSADAGDAYWNAGAGWAPLGSAAAAFATTFEGNGHTVSHLFINRSDDAGLFGVSTGAIRHVGVVDAAVTGASRVGALVGQNIGAIVGSYVKGSVSGGTNVGGLVGFNLFGGVYASYATTGVSGETSVGGLVGGNFGIVSASYATGGVTGAGQVGGLAGQHVGVVAVSYATGRVLGDTEVGGLAGAGGGRVTASYWDQETSGWPGAGAGSGQSTSALQGPTGYADLYAGWDVDVDGDGAADAAWHFGTAGQYPALVVDFDGDGQSTWQEFGRQLREGPVVKASSPASGTPVEVSWTAVDTSHWTPSPAVTYAVYRRAGDSEALVAAAVEGLSYTDSGAAAGVEYRYQVASRLSGGEASRSGAVGPNRWPEAVGALSAVRLRIAAGAVTVDVSGAFRDADDDELTYGVVSSAPAVASVSMSSSVVTLTPLSAGASTVTVTATDVAGSNRSARQQFVVTVANRPPEAVGTLSDRTLQIADGAVTVDVSGAFRDLDGDALTYGAASSSPAVATVSVSSSTLTLTPLSAGVSTVTVTATDAAGSNTSASQQFEVTVEAGGPFDYDADDDGLIEIATLAQLDAVRHDLDGDGAPTETGATAYAAAFPDPISGMGCPATGCAGYELASDLDFDTDGSGSPGTGDAYWNAGAGWVPLGSAAAAFATTFEGNGHTVSHLFINRGADAGLFGVSTSAIRHVGVVDASVTGASRVGGLVGQNVGAIHGSYATGSVSGGTSVGGLVGFNVFGGVYASYATAVVSGATSVGGLVGGNFGLVSASYATGGVTGSGQVGGLAGQHLGVVAVSYSTGRVSGDTEVGGLTGAGGGRVTASYWDQETSGWTGAGAGSGQSTSALQGPTGYAGLYARWDVDVDGDGSGDAPWDFGTSSEYPALSVDANGDGAATWRELGLQGRPAGSATSGVRRAAGVRSWGASFTDDPLWPGVTPVRAVHLLELRARIDGLRARAGLGAFGWTDATIRPGVTPARAVHVTELRKALAAAYAAAGRRAPAYTDPVVTAGATRLRALHLQELRAAVVALEAAAAGVTGVPSGGALRDAGLP